MSKIRVLLPAETGVDGADMKDTAGTTYETGPILVDQFWLYKYVVTIDATGAATVGDAKITVENLAPDGTTVIDNLDIVTAISTQVDGTCRIVWGGGVTGLQVGAGTVSADLEIMKMFYKINVILEVTTASDAATSSVATAYFQMEG